MVLFLSDQVSHLGNALELNLSKKQEKNIKNFYRKGGGKLIDSTVFFKKNGE
tara:strand:+ start:432 stop:587 length:156 start_codon:yes stop_codon:yes gene_type:complete